MSARFEVVRSDAEQPWHARLRVNGEITWWTEQYARKVGAERAVRSLVAAVHELRVRDVQIVTNVPGIESVVRVPPWTPAGLIAYVDERSSRGDLA